MKKNIFLALALALCMTACTEDYTDWAPPQSSEQGDVQNIEMRVRVEAPTSTIDMETIESDSVQLFYPIEVVSNVDADYILNLTTEEGLAYTLNVSSAGMASKEDLATAIVELFGKKQAERTMTAQVVSQTVVDGVTLKAASEKFTLVVLPAVPDLNYWIYGKQNNRDTQTKTLPLMPVTKELQTVTAYFSGKLDTKMWSDDTFGEGAQAYGAMGGNKSTPTGEFVVAGGYICSPSAGWYTLTFNFATYQYSFEMLNNQSPAEYTAIGLIGDFNSWASDAAMTQVKNAATGNSHCWYIQGVNLTSGGVKFRADGDWNVNWGAGVVIKDNPYGAGVQNGDNIQVAAGTYDVYFNDITGEFLFIEQ